MAGGMGQYLLTSVPLEFPSSVFSIPLFPLQSQGSELGGEGDPKPPSVSPAAEGEDAGVHSHAVS